MSEFYGDSHRDFQDRFDTRRLADGLESRIIRDTLSKTDKQYIAASDMFFLSTMDHNGWPTVSYKGGAKGFVRIVDDRTLAFPCYDGNGMFYSMGNISANGKVGLLFIDFVTPRRLRLHGIASIDDKDPMLADYMEACLIVRVRLENIFTNCARYIHRHERVEDSPHVPQAGRATPTADWKRVEEFQSFLPDKDKAAVSEETLISEREYRRDFWRGLSPEPEAED